MRIESKCQCGTTKHTLSIEAGLRIDTAGVIRWHCMHCGIYCSATCDTTLSIVKQYLKEVSLCKLLVA